MPKPTFRQVEAAERALAAQQKVQQARVYYGRYADDPVGYIRDVLGGEPWGKQEEICRLLLKPPYRVLVEASHSVGKTWLAAALTSWHYDCFETGWTISTAPTREHIEDVLWNEIRTQRARANLGGFSGSKAPILWDGPEHYAKGFTTAKGESFQGRHPERLFFIFDEATAIPSERWTNTKTMVKKTGKHRWLAILNPTDTASQAYAERHQVDVNGDPKWHVVQMSTLDHPNIAARLAGTPEPYPGAVDLDQFEDWLTAWSDPLEHGDKIKDTDLEWPPSSGKWYRPGPMMEGRALGRYPSSATYGVWSDRAWRLATEVSTREPRPSLLPEVGCDVARHGDDYTSMHSRWDHVSLAHERHNGWEYTQTAERLKELADHLAGTINAAREPQRKPVRPEDIPVKVDADAYGWGVMENKGSFNFIAIGASFSARKSLYPNMRSQLWFNSVDLAKAGNLCLARLPQATQHLLRQQLFSPMWYPTRGLMTVEEKAITKQRLGCSPDDADAMNLAYCDGQSRPMAEVVDTDDTPRRRDDRSRDARTGSHGLFGR